jgi:hypothetical protein
MILLLTQIKACNLPSSFERRTFVGERVYCCDGKYARQLAPGFSSTKSHQEKCGVWNIHIMTTHELRSATVAKLLSYPSEAVG